MCAAAAAHVCCEPTCSAEFECCSVHCAADLHDCIVTFVALLACAKAGIPGRTQSCMCYLFAPATDQRVACSSVKFDHTDHRYNFCAGCRACPCLSEWIFLNSVTTVIRLPLIIISRACSCEAANSLAAVQAQLSRVRVLAACPVFEKILTVCLFRERIYLRCHMNGMHSVAIPPTMCMMRHCMVSTVCQTLLHREDHTWNSEEIQGSSIRGDRKIFYSLF